MPRLDTETLDLFLATLREYAERELTPRGPPGARSRGHLPGPGAQGPERPARIGLHLLFIPEEYGGLGGGAYDIYRVSEVMAGIDLGIATGVLATFLGAIPLPWAARRSRSGRGWGGSRTRGCSWPTARPSRRPAATWPRSRRRRCRCTRTARSSATRSTGASSGFERRRGRCLHRPGNAPGGPSWFVVEQGRRASRTGKPEDKHGIRAEQHGRTLPGGCLRRADRLVGGVEGQGLAQAQAVFGYTRLMVAAFGLGAGWAALKRAIRYSPDAHPGRRAPEPEAGLHAQADRPRTPCAWRRRAPTSNGRPSGIDAGEPDLQTEGAVAKYMATEAGNRAAEDAIQALGGYGYTKSTWSRRSSATCASPRSTKAPPRSWSGRSRATAGSCTSRARGALLPRLGRAAGRAGSAGEPDGGAPRAPWPCARWPSLSSAAGSTG